MAKKVHTSKAHPDLIRFETIISELSELHIAKNTDYTGAQGYANFRSTSELGVLPSMGCLVRMNDKWNRLRVLMKKYSEQGSADVNMVKGESIIDTLNDLAVYSIICRILLEGEIKGEKE